MTILIISICSCSVFKKNITNDQLNLFTEDLKEKTMQKVYDKNSAFHFEHKIYLLYLAHKTRELQSTYPFIKQTKADEFIVDSTELTFAYHLSKKRGIHNSKESFIKNMNLLLSKFTSKIRDIIDLKVKKNKWWNIF